MKRCKLLIIIVFCSFFAKAQNNFFFGHYMFNPSYFNPGWLGSEESSFLTFQSRNQWLGYRSSFDGGGGAPTTQMLSTAIVFQDFFLSAVGMNIVNDDLGPLKNIEIKFPFAISKELQFGKISLGLSPTIAGMVLGDNLRFADSSDPYNIGKASQIMPDLTGGLFFQSNKGTYLGLSALNILQPGFDFDLDAQGLQNKQKISYAVNGGTKFSLKDGVSINPVFLLRSDLIRFTFDMGAIVTLREKIWTGVSYRRQESLILFLGYKMLPQNKLKVGYSFDYVIKDRSGKAATTHEIFIRYDLPDLILGGKKSVKTPRFSF